MRSPDDSHERCPTCSSPMPAGGVCRHCAPTQAGSASEPAAPRAGPKRIANYDIVRELGSGGMGTVYEAHEVTMKRRVALKVMSRHNAPSEKTALRFEHEAWIGGKLDHPNIVKVYERGTWEELSYFSMELVEGGSLADVVGNLQRKGRDESLGLDFGSREYIHWAIGQIIEVARGLEHAHQHGVVHRDIKPMNLLLSRELGSIKIADFGLAIEEDVTRMTTAGTILGTLAYMAPEQILGKSQQIGPHTDIYALGVTLFELLTLELPYSGKTQQLYMNAVLTTEARKPSKLNQKISRDLEIVIRKALEKDPRDRYATVGAFADDLENVVHLRPIRARPSGWWVAGAKWARRKPVHFALVVTLLLALPAVGYLSFQQVRHQRIATAARIEQMLKEASWLRERKRFGEALSLGSKVLALDRNHVGGLRERAINRMYLSLGTEETEDARALETGALEDVAKIIELAPDSAWPHALRAFLMVKLGREDEARAEQELARQLRTEELTDDELDLDAMLAMADERFEDAIENLSHLIMRRPDDARAIASRGFAYDALGQDDLAMNEYRLAIGLNPELGLTYIDLARLSKERGAHEEAAQYLERALELAPDSAHVHEAVAMNLVERGKRAVLAGDAETALEYFEQGEEAARKSIDLSPDRPWAYLNLGASLIEQGRLRSSDPDLILKAVEANDRAFSMMDAPSRRGEPETYAVALSNNCDALIELRRLDRALETCEEVVGLLPDDPVSHYNMAGVHALRGDRDRAFAALERDFDLGDRDWLYLEQDSWFESIRDDPRFAELTERMKQHGAG